MGYMQTVRFTLLNSFVIFNESENITEAAKRLGITQPALSKQLKEFERGIDIPVYTTQGRRKVLTPFGRSLHVRLKERLGNIHEIITNEQVRYQSPLYAKLSIAGRRGILDRISQRLTFEGSLFFVESSNDKIIESLQDLTAEIGISHIIPDSFELVAKPLFKEEFQLVIPKKLLALKPTLGKDLFSHLTKIPCLGYKSDDEIVRAVCSFYSENSSAINMFRATENYNSIKEMVLAKMGWAVIPSYLSLPAKETWRIPIPSKVLLRRQFYLIYRAEFSSVPWFKELILNIHACFRPNH
jgi:DNA-binding transcriptional LysR family regulator